MIKRFFTKGHKIRRLTEVPDGHGGFTEGWVTHLTIPGKLYPVKGEERLSADKTTYFARLQFVCHLHDITEKDRYEDPEGNEYDIQHIAKHTRPDGTGHMEIVVELRR